MTKPNHLGTQVFPALPEQLSVARGWLGERLGRSHPAHDDSVLLLSETFTNAVRHSSGDKVEISVFLSEESVHVEVVDGGGDTLPHCVTNPVGETGRGLNIVHALASSWGYEQEGGCLRFWFAVPTHRGGSGDETSA